MLVNRDDTGIYINIWPLYTLKVGLILTMKRHWQVPMQLGRNRLARLR